MDCSVMLYCLMDNSFSFDQELVVFPAVFSMLQGLVTFDKVISNHDLE